MNKIIEALKCVECRKTLSMPVFLPCGHMICQSHTTEDRKQITCSDCQKQFPNKEFTVAKAVLEILEANLTSFDFGKQHNESMKSCEELKKKLDQNDSILNDLDFYIHESISELRNRVLLKSEQLKKKVDDITQELLNHLDEYENKCKKACGERDTTRSLINEIVKQNGEAKTSWQKCWSDLNELKVDMEKWCQIKVKCDSTLKDLNESLECFKKDIFMNELGVKIYLVETFEKVDVDSVLEKQVYFKTNF